MSESMKEFSARLDREKQTKAMQDQADAMKKQTDLMERQQYEQKRAAKKEKRAQNTQAGKANFHGLYCLLIGWWLAMILVCCIVPLFFPGGRSFIKKAFGIW